MPGDVSPGYAFCRHLVEFFTSARYWLLEPNEAMLKPSAGSDGYALADPAGSEVLVYLPEAAPFELALPGVAATEWDVEWFDPRTRQKASGNATSAQTSFEPPSISGDRGAAAGDVALRLTRVV